MVIENKEKLLQSITSSRQYDESFYKHVYYNSKTDKTLSDEIAHKLIEVGRKDIVHAYNEWLNAYLEQNKEMLIRVSEWYCEQIDREFERKCKKCEVMQDNGRYKFTGLPQDF